MRRFAWAITGLCVVSWGCRASQPATPAAVEEIEEAPLELRELGPGVWAALQPHALRFMDANSLLVATEQGTVVVDAQTDPRAVEYLLDSFERMQLPPPRWLIYTHWHLDHTLGAAAYREASGGGLEVIGHQALSEGGLLATRTRAQLDELQASLEAAGRVELLEKVKVDLVEPTIAVSAAKTMELGGLRVVLHPVSAHTDGDLLVEFPELDLWATGDVLDALPFAGHGHPARWPDALGIIEAGPATQMLPGHGPVFEGPAQLELMREYWRVILDQVREAQAQGETLELFEARALAEGSPLAPLRDQLVVDGASTRALEVWLPEALQRAWAELKESPAQEASSRQ